MKTPKDITFSHLPFVPVVGQVIYVEPRHDAALNAFIRSHYDWLIDLFCQHGLHFCYLPLLMEQTLRYNAPYLKRKNLHLEAPSIFDYAAEGTIDRPMLVFAADAVEASAEHTFTLKAVAMDKGLLFSRKRMFRKLAEKVWQMTSFKSVSDEQKLRNREGILLNEELQKRWTRLADKIRLFRVETEKLIEEARVNQKEEPYIRLSLREPTFRRWQTPIEEELKMRRLRRESEKAKTETDSEKKGDDGGGVKFSLRKSDRYIEPKEKTPEDIEKERKSLEQELFRPEKIEIVDALFDSESIKITEDLLRCVDALRNRGVNTMLIHQIIDAHERLSRIRITKDFRIILTDYDNMEIEMTALPKAVFLLFLRHPEGIRFKELPDHYVELYDIYRRMQPIGTTEKQKQSVRDVTDPCKNSINEKCAQIRKAFVTAFDEHLASHYFVTGKRGEPKGIQLPRELVKWEE